MTEGYVNHDPATGRGHTREDVRAAAASLHEDLADLAATIDRIVADGDLVAVQGTITGTATSGERSEIRVSEFFRLENGRIAERWA
jgi:ketosteroid isomerase-like protein